jgi:hypothetical protein
MSRVLILVEGQTENAVIQKVLAPYLAEKEIYVYARIIGKPGHKGGNKFQIAMNDITMLIKQEPESIVTTFFDYYGLPSNWPGLFQATKNNDVIQKAKQVENGVLSKIQSLLGDRFNKNNFVPYIQMHELETLLFADPVIMAEVFEMPQLAENFQKLVEDCGSCEKINNDPLNAPSKRIEKLFPKYKKGRSVNAHAPLIIEKIGIDIIREKCPNFNRWLAALETKNVS